METLSTKPWIQGYQLPPTGPIGRVARLIGAGFMIWFGFEWAEAGLSWFSRASTPRNLWVWVVTGLALFGLYQLPEYVFGRLWGSRVLTGASVALATATVVTFTVQGELWAAPLTWLVYGLDIAWFLVITGSFLSAALLGTPGCELGGLAQLIRRLRQGADTDQQEAMWCVVGLHRLDAWEASRREKLTR